MQALQILAALLWQRRGCGHPAQLPRVTLLAVLASTRTASPCHLWPPARAPQSPGCTGAAGGVARGSSRHPQRRQPCRLLPPSSSPYGGSETLHDPGPGAEQHLLPFVTAHKSDRGWDWAAAPACCLPRELCTQGRGQPCNAGVLGQKEVAKQPEAKLPCLTQQLRSTTDSRLVSPCSPHHAQRGLGAPRTVVPQGCSGDSTNSPRSSRSGVM